MKTSFLSKLSSEEAQSQADSSTPGQLIINRAYQFWPGTHQFLWNGKIMLGPRSDVYVYFFFALLMLLHFGLFSFVLVPNVSESMQVYLISLYSIFFVCSVFFYCMTAMVEPGVMPPKQYLDVPRTYNLDDPFIEQSSLMRKYLGGRFGATFALHWKQQWNSSNDGYEDLIRPPLASELRSDVDGKLAVVMEEPQVASYRGFGDDPDFHDDIFTYRSESEARAEVVGENITKSIREIEKDQKVADQKIEIDSNEERSQKLDQLLSKVGKSEDDNEDEIEEEKRAFSVEPEIESEKAESSKKIFGPEESMSEKDIKSSLNNQNKDEIVLYNEVRSVKSNGAQPEWGHEENSCFEQHHHDCHNEFDTRGKNWLLEEYRSKFCPICKIHRPQYTKHCKTCNCCVSKHNHHSPFVNNCIGKRNYRWFLALMFSLFLLNIYFIITLFLAFPNLLKFDGDFSQIVIMGCFIQSVLITGYCGFHIVSFASYLAGDTGVIHDSERSPLREFISGRIRRGQFDDKFQLASRKFQSVASPMKLGHLSGCKKEKMPAVIPEFPSLESEGVSLEDNGRAKVMRFGSNLSLHSKTLSQNSGLVNVGSGLGSDGLAESVKSLDKEIEGDKMKTLNGAGKIFLSSIQEPIVRTLGSRSNENQDQIVLENSQGIRSRSLKSGNHGSTDYSRRSLPLSGGLGHSLQSRKVEQPNFLSEISSIQKDKKSVDNERNINSEKSDSMDIISSPNIVLCRELTAAARQRRAQTSFPMKIVNMFPGLFPANARANETLNDSNADVSVALEQGSIIDNLNGERRFQVLNESTLARLERQVKPRELEILEEKEKFDFFKDSVCMINFEVELDIYESNRLSTTRRICTK